MENPMLDFADDLSHAYQDGFNDGVASVAKPFGNGMDVCPVCGSPSTIGKPVTNADRIRAMTDEELSQFLCSWHNAEECHHCVAERFCEYGHTGMIDWLQQEADE